MATSLILGAVSGAVFLILALVVWWKIFVVNRRAVAQLSLGRQRLLRLIVAVMVVLGFGVATAVFFHEQGLRHSTVYEALLAGTLQMAPGDDAPVRGFSVPIEHPGVAHRLFFSPVDRSLKGPRHAVRLTVSVFGPDGRLLLTQEQTFEPEVSKWRSGKTAWPGCELVFTPAGSGDHRVEITPLSPAIDRIHVLLTDPEKRDGRRMKGF